MKLGLQNKVAIITGAAQGIGKSIALTLANEQVKVVMADINFYQAKLAAGQIAKLGQEVLPIKVDVLQLKDLDKLVNKTIDRFGRIDILVNNAGVCPRTDFEQITEGEWDQVLAVNLKSVFLLSQTVIPYMKKRRQGKIINIASGAAKIGGLQVGAHYSASKAGVICLTKTLALEGAKFGIQANAVCPGVIETHMTTCISSKQIQSYKRKIPLGRLGAADEVAYTVLFLVSEAANYITGEIVDVNGGLIMD